MQTAEARRRNRNRPSDTNELHDRLGLPEAFNGRISQEVTQLIECSLP
jgi:hypothetical protein